MWGCKKLVLTSKRQVPFDKMSQTVDEFKKLEIIVQLSVKYNFSHLQLIFNYAQQTVSGCVPCIVLHLLFGKHC